MLGRIADFFRFWWCLFYWNGRKTAFRWRRGKGRCPCQDPSDSGKALETRCEASAGWSEPARFRRICPLLTATPEGWRCSASASSVKPFWARAFGYSSIAALGTYLVVTFLLFVLFLAVGYPVGYWSVAWPPRWHQIPPARAVYFQNRADDAFARGDIREELLSLSVAYSLDRSRYPTGLELAQKWQLSGQPTLADQIYQQLLLDHPDRRQQTAQSWLRALLLRCDFQQIQRLATDEIALSPDGGEGAWVRALLVASRYTGDEQLLTRLTELQHLPPPLRQLLKAELHLRRGNRELALPLLTAPQGTAVFPYLAYHQAEQLIRLGELTEALLLLDRYQGKIGMMEEASLRMSIFHRQGWKTLFEWESDRLLAAGLSPKLVEFAAAFCIRHPGSGLLEKLLTAQRQSKEPPEMELLGALFVATGAAGAWTDLHAVRASIEEGFGRDYAALDGFVRFFQESSQHGGDAIRHHLSVLPLPVEVLYSLLEAYAPVPDAARPANGPAT